MMRFNLTEITKYRLNLKNNLLLIIKCKIKIKKTIIKQKMLILYK